MSEIKTNKKVAKIMPGTDYKTGDLKAYDLQNTLIMGRNGSGIQNVVNNILLHMVEDYSARELCIQYFPAHKEGNPWLNENRKISHFVNQVYNYSDSNIEWKKTMCACCVAMNEQTMERGMLVGRKNVIVLEITPDILENEINWLYVKDIVRLANGYDNMCVILVSLYESDKFEELNDYIGLRILTRTSEKMSNTFLGCNLSSMETQKSGFVWVTELSNFYNKKRLEVDFKPDSYLSKVCKFLSSKSNIEYDMYRAALDLLYRGGHIEDKIRNAIVSQSINCLRDYRQVTTLQKWDIESLLNLYPEHLSIFLDKVEQGDREIEEWKEACRNGEV